MPATPIISAGDDVDDVSGDEDDGDENDGREDLPMLEDESIHCFEGHSGEQMQSIH